MRAESGPSPSRSNGAASDASCRAAKAARSTGVPKPRRPRTSQNSAAAAPAITSVTDTTVITDFMVGIIARGTGVGAGRARVVRPAVRPDGRRVPVRAGVGPDLPDRPASAPDHGKLTTLLGVVLDAVTAPVSLMTWLMVPTPPSETVSTEWNRTPEALGTSKAW